MAKKIDGYDLVSEEIEAQEEIIVELGMTESQVRSLKWVLICWLGQYGSNESSPLKNDIEAIHLALEGVET